MTQPRVLLLQARRAGDPMREHEVQCFAARTEATIVSHNLLDGPPTAAAVRQCDALMVGGSGDYYASKGDLPHNDAFMDFLRRHAEAGPPLFAVCFGYHCLVRALGGEIVHDPPRTEVGTYTLELTDAGAADPLLGATLPRRFRAQMGHKDRPSRHPPELENLASSSNSALQALRIPKRPVWGVQFHPELNRRDNRYRFDYYAEGYARSMTAAQKDAVTTRFADSPEASRVLAAFLRFV